MSRSCRHALGPAILAMSALHACTGSDPVLVAGPTVTPDASVEPADGGDAATAADAVASGNLLLAGDFETTNCTAWSPTSASKLTSSTARTGASSCIVCYNPAAVDPESTYSLSQGIPVRDLIEGATYTARVWVRRSAEDAQLPATDVHLELTLIDGFGQPVAVPPYTDEKLGPLPRFEEAWVQIATDYTYARAPSSSRSPS